MGGLQACSEHVQGRLNRYFYKWGLVVGRRPCTVIWTTLLITVLLSLRVFVSFVPGNSLPIEVETDKLWVPQDAPAIDEKASYEANFDVPYRLNEVIFTTKPDGGNVLTQTVLTEIQRFDAMVRQDLYAYSEDGVDLVLGRANYTDLCARATEDAADTTLATCIGAMSGNTLELFAKADGSYDFGFTDAQIFAMVTSGSGVDSTLFPAGGRTVNIIPRLGGVTYAADGTTVTGAKSLKLIFYLQGGPITSDSGKASIGFEDQLNLLVGTDWTDADLSKGAVAPDGTLSWTSTIVDVYPNTWGAASRELGKSISGDLVSIQISYMIIFVYATFIFSKASPRSSRALLAVAGIVSVGLAVMVGYGFTTLFVSLNPVVNVLPFILIGIGVDDMFILLFALDASPKDLPVPERIAMAMSSAGVSITITSLTDLLAFILGMTSRLPALSGFCTFAAIGILADYLCQITFFAGWMALDLYREKKNKVDCCPCLCKPTEATSSCPPCCCLPPTYGTCSGIGSYGLKPFIKKYYIPLLRSPIVKAVVIVGFVGFTSFSAYAASNLKQDFQRRWFIADDSTLQDTYAVQDKYYGGWGVPVYIVTPPTTEVDYASVASQTDILNLESEINANEWVEDGSLASWYDAFRDWVHSCDDTITYLGSSCTKRSCLDASSSLAFPYCSYAKVLRDASGAALSTTPSADVKYMVDASGNTLAPGAPLSSAYVPPAQFWAYLDQFVQDEPLGKAFASEVVWKVSSGGGTGGVRTPAEVADGVSAARMRAQFKAAVSSGDRVALMDTMRASIAKAAFGSSYSYTFTYLFYEQFKIISHEAVFNLAMALVAVIVITLVMIADVGATVLVALCVVCTDIDILGMMWYWGLTIDSIAVINLVLAIGLALDYSVHIAHAFTLKPGASRQERIDAALEEMGTPVIHGCLSTFLAVVVLSVSKSYVFRVFFKMFLGIVVFGGLHGLVLLPVVLSLIGPSYVDVSAHAVKPAAKGSFTTSMSDATMASEAVPPVKSTPPTSPIPSPPASEFEAEEAATGPKAAWPVRGSAPVAPHIV